MTMTATTARLLDQLARSRPSGGQTRGDVLLGMTAVGDLIAVMRAIGSGERAVAEQLLDATPQLMLARIGRTEEFFLEDCRAQVYAGDTALHAAAFAYDTVFARRLVESGADVHARNRRGSEPLHAATIGGPGSSHWDPTRQRAVIEYLIDVGADPNGAAMGGVTPLHRAVRNRCSTAVEALLRRGADPHLTNDNGSTAFELARWTTGRPGSGSTEARAEQQLIVELLARAAR
jgi:Ankyrin repeats (many copies)